MYASPLVASPTSRACFTALCAALLPGCMAAGNKGDDTGAADSGFFDDTGTDDTGGDTGLDEVPPAFLRLAAEVLVEDGIPVADESRLRVTLLGSEADDLVELCTGVRSVGSLSEETSPDESILAWWRVIPDTGDGACPDDALPASLDLGVGVLQPDVAALLGAQGWTGTRDVLYGAYVLLPDPGDLWTFGYAWTREALENDTPASATPPLPDGVWQVEPVYLLPY